MTRDRALWIALCSTGLLVAAVLVVLAAAPAGNTRFADAATLLAFVSAAAVGIERTIELGWTLLGSFIGSFWPLNAVSKQVDTLVDDLDGAVAPFYKLTDKLTEEQLAKVAAAVEATPQTVQAELEKLNDSFAMLKGQPRDPQRVQLLLTAAAHDVKYLTAKYEAVLPDLTAAAKVAGEAINGLQDFTASFKDNPGRRLISLYVGAIAGLAVAGMFGLDLFSAILEPATADGSTSANSPLTAHPRLNVVLTGIVIGLGSSPTHEVIRLVQEYKERQKGENRSTPDKP